VNDHLNRICASKRQHVAERKVKAPLGALERRAKSQAAPLGFRARLAEQAAAGRYGLICEIKKASPSAGLIRPDFDPSALARAYRDGGATCLSVLTDTPYFQGRDEDLIAAKAACGLPVLRKDFIVDPYQVAESRSLGADCLLLILAAVENKLAMEIEEAAISHSMDVLIEVHDIVELERALRLRSRLIGINNRNLRSLKTDISTSEKLAAELPPGSLAVAESGLGTPADLARLAAAGVRCFLIGESLLRQADVAAATRRLIASAGSRAAE
jgi:indole-3-glycerol phosphate synthase